MGLRVPGSTAAGLALVFALAGTAGAAEVEVGHRSAAELRSATVVPRPQGFEARPGVWVCPPALVVDWGPVAEADRRALAGRLDLVLGARGLGWASGPPGAADLVFAPGPTDEAYRLEISPEGVRIEASGTGRLWALMTLNQLLPLVGSGEPAQARAGVWNDAPAFSWRGLMVDTSRTFFSVADLETVLEWMALHKLNRFHWHLTDDQGWRLEVPTWPRLTEVGAWRVEADGRRVGGFYSTAEVRHLVAYAADRGIVVVPEIDLPGHASAALAAYPELSADGKPRPVPTAWNTADGVLSLGRASVERFTGDLLATLIDLFPGPWIHWGGDEVFRFPWLKNAESQAWMRRNRVTTAEASLAAWWSALANKTLAAGKTPLGWDGDATEGAPTASVLHWWDNPEAALRALKAGRDLVISVKESLYLDYPEVAHDGDRAWWMPVTAPDQVAKAPLSPPGATGREKGRVLGLEAVLFTERVTPGQLGRKLFPRLALMADRAWTGGEVWGIPTPDHLERLAAWGVGMPVPPR